MRVQALSIGTSGETSSIKGMRKGSKTFDPPSISDGAQTTTTVTVSFASLGETVMVSFSLDLQDIVLTGYVSAANTVTVIFRNDTGGAIDLASGTLLVTAWGF